MIPLTPDQIEEALIRLQAMCRWMYYSDGAVARLQSLDPGMVSGVPARVTPQEDGKVVVTLLDTGIQAVFDVQVVTAPLAPGTIDGYEFRHQIVNRAELSDSSLAVFAQAVPFVYSYFQRLVAFTFLARMHPESRAGIASHLAGMTDSAPPSQSGLDTLPHLG